MNVKKLALAFFATMTAGSVVTIASVSNSNSILTLAQECDHVGNHYTAKNPTSSEAGTKEYWVCCKCHEHYLSQPEPKSSYTWNEAGVAGAVDSTDDRYWTLDEYSKSTEMVDDLKELGFGTVSNYQNKANNGYTVSNYNGEPTLILPDGVKQVSTSAFKNYEKNKLQWIVIPKGCTVAEGAFSTQQTCVIYFCGNNNTGNWSRYSLEIYKVIGTGWDYVNGVPQAK